MSESNVSKLKQAPVGVKYHKLHTSTYEIDSRREVKKRSKSGKCLRTLEKCLGWLITLCLLAIVALLSYRVMNNHLLNICGEKTPVKADLCSIDENNRFDCWPEGVGATEEKCLQRGCCWKPSSKPETAPYCFFQNNYNGYNVSTMSETSSGIVATLVRSTSTFFSHDVKTLRLQVSYQTESRLRIKFYDPSSARYEVPLDVPSESVAVENPLYTVSVVKEPFSIIVKRTSTGDVVFDTTNLAPLIFSDQFLQISTKLSTEYLYGLGEHRRPFLQDLSTWKRLVFWNRDHVPQVGVNGYGTHPFFLNLEPQTGANGLPNAHGVFLLNSNAGEVALQPYGASKTGAITYRFIGGILDFFILMGPDPISVASQFTEVIGRPYLPPFWSLGFHLCKWGYNSAATLQEVIKRNRDANMPYVAFQPYGSEKTGALTYRMLGGVLDFFVVMGPEPMSVVQQYSDVIGRPYLPPFWSLGFHICKYGIETAADLQTIIKRNRDANIPYDVQWNDIDYMVDHRDWTYDKDRYEDLPNIVKDLHDNNQRYIIMADPAISSDQPEGSYPPFDQGKQLDVFIKNTTDDILIGQVWPGETAFPDFFHPKAVQYWYSQAKAFHSQIPFDGLWIDMNEPSNFVDGSVNGCPGTSLDIPPYVPPVDGGSLVAKTVCPSAKQSISTHYNLHNMYGWSQANVSRVVLNLLLGKRAPMITRSSFPGSGRNTGHWLGDNNSDYDDLYYSIPGILNFNLFGIPQIGADICGFRGQTTPELCTRWTQLGAFYPFMRNHADDQSPGQDPGIFKKPYQDYIRTAIELRYQLLAVLYNGFVRASLEGTPIVRPLFYMYPGTEAIDRQFMWNDQLLITPVLEEGATSVVGHIPADTWYDFYNGTVIDGKGQTMTLDAPIDRINVHVRGGSILPLLPVTQRTDAASILGCDTNKRKLEVGRRMAPFRLMVALDAHGLANGELFWDDGETRFVLQHKNYTQVLFTMETKNTLKGNASTAGYTPPQGILLGGLTVYGVAQIPQTVSVNGAQSGFSYNKATKVLNAVFDQLTVDLLKPLEIIWS